MKKVRNIIALLLCAILLVGASVAGTVAYLTSNDKVVNTFTVGKVIITLDEKDVDEDSYEDDNVTVDGVDRDKANAYTLIPGKKYEKDPVIHVDSTSESCWVFVKVINDIEKFEVGTTISDQILANHWQPVDGFSNVYYQVYDADQTNPDTELEVFQGFTLSDEAQDIEGWNSIDENTKITVIGYAVQYDAFNSAKDAWNNTFADNT
jgi:predicted ribosomally synthesized peptide with SipW-like signal peptide